MIDPKVSDPWKDADGRTHEVRVSPEPQETEEALCARFEVALAAAKEEFPPV